MEGHERAAEVVSIVGNASVDVDELRNSILKCKQRALAKKREGDIEAAKQALLESKGLQRQLDELLKQQLSTSTSTCTSASVSSSTVETDLPASNQTQEIQTNSVHHAIEDSKDGISDAKNKGDNIVGNGYAAVDDDDKITSAKDLDVDADADAHLIQEFTKKAVTGDVLDAEIDTETDAALLKELSNSQSSLSNNEDSEDKLEEERLSSPTFSMKEMMDLEMVQEFASHGMPVPSQKEYQDAIGQCKQKAVAFREQGNKTEALKYMRWFKQLQLVETQVIRPLSISSSSSSSDIHTNNISSSSGQEDVGNMTEEEKLLLQELILHSTGGAGAIDDNHTVDDAMVANNSISTTTERARLDLQDMTQMDVSEIRDALSLGMEVPSIDDLEKTIQQEKLRAQKLKQLGDIPGALSALKNFKTWSEQFVQWKAILEEKEKVQNSHNSDISQSSICSTEDGAIYDEAYLERLLLEEQENTRKNTTKKTEKSVARLPPKTSKELREEAIQLRNEKKITEATAVLKLYKTALAREQKEAQDQEQNRVLELIQLEIEEAQIQRRRFSLWEQLVDSQTGIQQQEAWFRYQDLCAKVIVLIQNDGLASISITEPDPINISPAADLSLIRKLPEDMTSIVRHGISDKEETRVEVQIVDVMDIHKNKVFQNLTMQEKDLFAFVQFEILLSIQLPSSPEEPDKPIELQLYSPVMKLDEIMRGPTEESHLSGSIQFSKEPSYISLERGETKFAKTILRRMERRKIILSLLCHAKDDPSKIEGKRMGWFRGSAKKGEMITSSLNLGKAVLETKALLEEMCITGEYPLVGNAKRATGGLIRFCIRTGLPFRKASSSEGDDSIGEKTSNSVHSILGSLPIHAPLTFASNTSKTHKG